MTLPPTRPLASGRPYHVKACRGRVPTALADFEGETDFTLSTDVGTTLVRGVGTAHGDWVRFAEGAARSGEVRVWHITMEADGGFTAATGPSTVSAFGWPFERRPGSPG